MNPFSK